MDGFKKFITHYNADDTIYKRGDIQTDFYIINKGKVELLLNDSKKAVVTLSKGDFFGEESLNDEQGAVYTVRVTEDSDIIKIPYNSLVDMMKKSTGISLKILKKLSEKHIKILQSALIMEKTPVVVTDSPSEEVDISEDEKTSEMLPMDVKAYLVIERSNRVVQLSKSHTYLGRRDYTTGSVPDVDLTKEDEEKYISRRHSKISYIDSIFYVSEEPGAVNGTFLNGTKLATGVKHELHDKDELTLCHLNIIFKH
ncbi:MAG: cyclic nucleotide-binding domain-containing protein [bacterium]|nr:cyclic nucleotide-binding domain-containing protein [bacterium]